MKEISTFMGLYRRLRRGGIRVGFPGITIRPYIIPVWRPDQIPITNMGMYLI